MGKGKAKGKEKGGKGTEKKVKKIVEDKTFGLKNKNKSKKVQQYIKQVNSVARGKSDAQVRAESAAKKKAKEDQKKAELEMLALLGDSYKPKDRKLKKKQKGDEQKKQEEAKAQEKAQYERDFADPITTLDQVLHCDSKAKVPRVCAELVHKDNLVTKNKDGSNSLLVKIDDGSTMRPFILTIFGETPSNFEPKVGMVLDIRDAVAMVRGDRVALEITKGATEGTYTVAGPSLADHIKEVKTEREEIRAQGGIPIEELIEQQRAELKYDDLTPVTKESFYAWKEKKKQARADEWEKKRKDAAKKSGGKGLNVLSGKALFAYDPTLFKDDESALHNKEYELVDPENEKSGEEAKTAGAKEEATAATTDDKDVAVVDGVAVKLQEDLYVGGDDDLDDLDDLDDE